MCKVRYITNKEYKKELELQLATQKRMLQVVPSERHKQEVLKMIDDIEKEMGRLN